MDLTYAIDADGTSSSPSSLFSRYVQRNIHHLQGLEDHAKGDRRCAAQVQGSYHLRRGEYWAGWLQTQGEWPERTTIDYVPGIGHDDQGMVSTADELLIFLSRYPEVADRFAPRHSSHPQTASRDYSTTTTTGNPKRAKVTRRTGTLTESSTDLIRPKHGACGWRRWVGSLGLKALEEVTSVSGLLEHGHLPPFPILLPAFALLSLSLSLSLPLLGFPCVRLFYRPSDLNTLEPYSPHSFASLLPFGLSPFAFRLSCPFVNSA